MRRKLFITGIIVLVLLIILYVVWYFIGKDALGKQTFTTKVKKGDFQISVITEGELVARHCDYVYGPTELKELGISQVKINDMVQEGTFVKRGDYVASLDPTELNSKIVDIKAELDKLQNQLTKTKIDTELDLRNERDKLASLKFTMDEAQVTVDQSKYEPPATIRQVEIALEKSKRDYTQASKNYSLKLEQDKTKVEEIKTNYENSKTKYDLLDRAINSMTIRAPKDGIIIYKRERGSDKLGAGSIISTYANIIALMPDLSQVISKTYVNEIDIGKIVTNMDVQISVDAFPDKKYEGKVVSIGSIGETLPNSETKVFEVDIQINSKESGDISQKLKPGMTTKNTIIISKIKDVLYIPIECVHSINNTTFVFKNTATGFLKTEVTTGQSNENEIIIVKGLSENDEVSLDIPENADNLVLNKLN